MYMGKKLNDIRSYLSANLINWRGWKTNRKIVVIESDDWGSIRMPSKKVYQRCLNNGIKVDNSPYCKYDSLASEQDLDYLFSVLNKHFDSNGSPAVLTANCVVANPDFDKIRRNNYQAYEYECISETFKKYPNHSNCLTLWKDGKNIGVFHPQFHGREHLNINLWLNFLKNRHPQFCAAFEDRFWGLSNDVIDGHAISIQASFDAMEQKEIFGHSEIILDGVKIFQKLFGYKSKSFIANNFIWSPDIEPALKKGGVRYIQGMKYQKMPLLNSKKREMLRHHVGDRNVTGQLYLIRNCIFEPTQSNPNFDNVGHCLKQIRNAFSWNKPAIIMSHRLNYVGFLDEKNRNQNLGKLDMLLGNIKRLWPEVEFLTSDELGTVIENDFATV